MKAFKSPTKFHKS